MTIMIGRRETEPVFCLNCGRIQDVQIRSARRETQVRDKKFSFVEQRAFCPTCGEEVYVPVLNDENAQQREIAYRKAAGLITVQEIQCILDQYHIGAGPLARVLGFGEVTISRYLGGQLPSKSHSQKLLEVLASPRRLEEYLEENRDCISEVAYRKCREQLDAIAQRRSGSKIEAAAFYLLGRVRDITPLALQKLLYYAQSFFFVLYGEELFPDTCQAWVHGPVFPEIYYNYRTHSCILPDEPPLACDESHQQLSEKEIAFLNEVVSAFGCYSGAVLEQMTHRERPWIEARGNLQPDDHSRTEISKYAIHEYFRQAAERDGILNPCDIKRYSERMYQSIKI